VKAEKEERKREEEKALKTGNIFLYLFVS